MVDGEYLDFDNETIDDGTECVVVYGSQWRRWILAAVSQLRDPRIWTPECDRDLAVSYAEELIRRLMGGDVYFSQVAPILPISLSPLAMRLADGMVLNASYGAPACFFSERSISSGDVELADWLYFRVYLGLGKYFVRVWHDKNSMRGRFRVQVPTGIEGSELIGDCYNNILLINEYSQEQWRVDVPGQFELCIEKYGKNAASSGGSLVLNRVDIIRCEG